MKKIIVLKISGKVLENQKDLLSLFPAIKKLSKKFSICIVHGGGKQADSLQEKLGIPVNKINGRRITDKPVLEIAKMIYGGKINIEILSLCKKYAIPAIGISGADAGLIEVVKRPVQIIFNNKTNEYAHVDFGFVGDITTVHPDILKFLFQGNYIPVIASLGTDPVGQIYNINSDTLATEIAIKLKSKVLIFISDVSGIILKKNIIKKSTTYELENFIANKYITNGMIPKIENAKLALKNNVKNIQIIGNLVKTQQWVDAIIDHKYGTTII